MANNAITKISARAKQIRKKSPAKSWKACIKEASRDYNGGRLGAAKKVARKKKRVSRKVKYRQTGMSNRKSDARVKANVPLVVIGDPLTDKNDGTVAATLVTVPLPLAIDSLIWKRACNCDVCASN